MVKNAVMSISSTPTVQFDAKYCSGTYVYAWVRDKTWLYVGMTTTGMGRAFRHNIIGRAEDCQINDRIWIWEFSAYGDAAAFERELTLEKLPIYSAAAEQVRRNGDKTCREISCPACKKQFKQKRYWQVYCSQLCRDGYERLPEKLPVG